MSSSIKSNKAVGSHARETNLPFDIDLEHTETGSYTLHIPFYCVYERVEPSDINV